MLSWNCVIITVLSLASFFSLLTSVSAHSVKSNRIKEWRAKLEGNYIVVLKSNFKKAEAVISDLDNVIKNEAEKHGKKWSGKAKSHHHCEGDADACILRKFPHASSYSAKLTESMAKILNDRDDVEYVEKDQPVFKVEDVPLEAVDVPFEESVVEPWGLRRIANRTGISSKYTFPEPGGQGVDVYIVDTGIKTDHEQFEGRASFLADFSGEGFNDLDGHGTHVAGTVGGFTYGVARKASLFALKALGVNGGTISSVIAAINFAIQRTGAQKKALKSVLNLSLGGGKSLSLNAAIQSAIDAGIAVAVAAGNTGDDACLYSPGSATNAISTGAVDYNDTIAYFSNYGSCVDIFAPGVTVRSAGIASTNASVPMSGTSMASPHVAGVLALALAANPNKFSTVYEVNQFILGKATAGPVLGILQGSPNLLLFNGVGPFFATTTTKTTTTTTLRTTTSSTTTTSTKTTSTTTKSLTSTTTSKTTTTTTKLAITTTPTKTTLKSTFTTTITVKSTSATSNKLISPVLLGDWAFCTSSSQCANKCCSKQYSNDGKFKCTPGGTLSQCLSNPTTVTKAMTITTKPTALLGLWEFCTASSQCAVKCCSNVLSDDKKFKCTPNTSKCL
ncbi:serine protease [Nowakowskiella sp. JEL0407]|nr:serine protease [Nowakowskiella sp. JEL0407]